MSGKFPSDLNKDKITINDINRLQELCLQSIKNDELYELRNDAKLRAVYSSKSYDEFKDIVDAAHLRPLSKFDKQNAKTKNRLWNSITKSDSHINMS